MNAEIGKLYYKIEADMRNVKAGLAELKTQAAQADRQVSGSFNRLSSSFSGIGAAIGAFSGYAIVQAITSIGRAAIQGSMQMEMYRANFETMMGSAEAAGEMLQNLRDMAARTPFATEDLVEASQTLMQMGIEAQDIQPVLQRLGDISQGNSEKMRGLALVYAQVQSQGRLMTQDMYQMINRGFNPLLEISRTTGISMRDLRKRMEEGSISAQMVAEAFRTATAEGGQFHDGMSRAAETLTGQWSTFKDNLNEVVISLGDRLNPILRDTLKEINDLYAAMQSGRYWDNFARGLRNLDSQLGMILPGIREINSMMRLRQFRNSGFTVDTLRVTRPTSGGGTTAPTGSGTGRGVSWDSEMGAIAERLRESYQNVIADIKQKNADLESPIAAMMRDFSKDSAEAIEKVNGYFGKIAAVANQLSSQLGAIWKMSAQNQLTELSNTQKQYTAILDMQKAQALEAAGVEEDDDLAKVDKEIAQLETRLKLETDLKEQAKIRDELATKRSERNKLSIVSDYDTKKKALDDAAEARKKAIQKREAQRQKKLAIADTIISTAQAAMAAYASLVKIPYVGWALGIAAAAATIAFGGVQVSLIASQPTEFAAGGLVTGPTVGMIGEAGDEAVLPLNDSVMNRLASAITRQLVQLTESKNTGGDFGAYHTTVHTSVNLDGKTIARTTDTYRESTARSLGGQNYAIGSAY